MKSLIAILFLVLPLVAQTRTELDSKYGPIEGNRYLIGKGIAAEVEFSGDGRAKTFRIVSDDFKDSNKLLNADDVRKVIRELAGSRMCRPISSAKIAVECPQRKGCFGVREVWRSMTTFFVWHKKSVQYATVTLLDEPIIPPPGFIKLLPGYVHLAGCGIDTQVGSIKKEDGIEIRYDIGHMAGNFAKRNSNPDTSQWIRTEKVGNDSVLIVLNKQNRVFATFEKAAANFYASVSSSSDVDDFVNIVLTYRP